MNFLHEIASVNEPSWVVPWLLPHKFKMVDGGHIEFCKMQISPYKIKKVAHSFVKDATQDRLQTMTARRLSAFDVVESVTMTTASSSVLKRFILLVRSIT